MPRIRLTSDVLKQKAGEITQCMDDQKQVINDVAKLIEEIVSDWEGEAQKGFIATFENVKPTYEKFAPDLSDFANFLTNYANTNEYLDVGGREDIVSRGAGAGA
ncbi:MAG: WXG100 family type VII secretion target [Synergistaceae bacterium]|nr:WXG100 family type VII secretion target [Synergistaceae bacterium]